MSLDIIGPANAPNAVTSRPTDTRTGTFGATDTWMKDCSSAAANDGTKLQAGLFNSILAQVRNLIRGNGLTAGSADVVTQDNTNDSMMLKSVQHLIQRGQPLYAVDTGTPNAVVVALSPAAPEYKEGMSFRVKLSNAVTGAAVINVNGLGNKAIVKSSAAPLIGNEWSIGDVVDFTYDGTNFQVGAPPAGRLLNVQVITTTSTYTPTPGMKFIIAEGVAGGGGGAGATTTTAGNVSIGSPGSAGAWGKGYYTSAQVGASQAVTIGAGGGTSGGNGTSTSLGALLVIPYGIGGSPLNGATPPTFNGAGNIAASPTGANIAFSSGVAPGYSIALSTTGALGGAGGSGPFGTSGAVLANTNGSAGTGYGSGGSGSALLGTHASILGGAGAPGLMIIMEYGE